MKARKRNGELEELDISKGTKCLTWACKGLENVSVSEIEMRSKLHFYDGIETKYIHNVYIKTVEDLIAPGYYDYDKVARNLKLQKLYKDLYNCITPCRLTDYIKRFGKYYNKKINDFSEYDLDYLDIHIDHDRDFNFSSSGLDSLLHSYGKKDEKGNFIQSPQFLFMTTAMDAVPLQLKNSCLDNTDYLDMIVQEYNDLSLFKKTYPTPVMNAMGTESTDYASCCALKIGDSIDSWVEGDKALVLHTTASQGVGVDITDIASLGDLVKQGNISHSGKIPVLKSIDTTVGKTSQNNRRGSATAFINFFDPEIVKILALKSPRTNVEERINDLSYGIILHQLVYDRAKRNENITLVSTRQAPDICLRSTQPDFEDYYKSLEEQFPNNTKISARELFERLKTEAAENSAYYIMNIDEVNNNTPYLEPIHQSNICVEFTVPTKALSSKRPNSPDIGICVLGNVNQGVLSDPKDLKGVVKRLVTFQSFNALTQNHPTSQANAFVKEYRDIGLGFSNHAYWLAKNNWKYGDQEALNAHNRWMEHYCYYAIDTSVELAKHYGKAPKFDTTSWMDFMPFERANANAKALITDELTTLDWQGLKQKIRKYGMFNCGLLMQPPGESSSVPTSQTSSTEPIKNTITIKDKYGKNFKQLAPEVSTLEFKYDLAYNRESINKDYLKHIAVTQIWMDKSISTNLFYNPELYENGKVPDKLMYQDLFYAKNLGIKTIYYHNTKMPDEEDLVEKEVCAGGGCSM
jgi:ribonucleoside-diphosphate reductase alpha chain